MFDPYLKWFGIPGDGEPPASWELLGVAPGERRPEVIREAALRQTARIRPYQTGPYAEACTRLLNEIAQAELTLLGSTRHADHDAGPNGVPTADADGSVQELSEEEATPDTAAVSVLLLEPLPPPAPRGCVWHHPRRRAARARFRAGPALAAVSAFLMLFGATALGVMATLDRRPPEPSGPMPVVEPAPLRGRVGEVRCLQGQMPVYGVAFSPDGRTLLSGGGGYVKGPGNTVVPRECVARQWDVETGEELRRFVGHTAPVRCVCFSLDGQYAVSGAGGVETRTGGPVAVDCTVRLWDVVHGREARCFRGHTAPVLSVAFFPDGRTAASAGRDGTLRLWDVQTGTELRCLEPEPGAIATVAVAPDGSSFLCGGEEGILRLWQTEDRERPRTFSPVEGRITCAAFSPDGRQLLCASGRPEQTGGALQLLDVETARVIRGYAGHHGSVTCVAFSPDGRRAVSGGSDQTVRMWDVAGGQELARFTGHTDTVQAVVFSPDGRLAASAGHDGTVRVWNLPD
jgi:WD40 repeat protein